MIGDVVTADGVDYVKSWDGVNDGRDGDLLLVPPFVPVDTCTFKPSRAGRPSVHAQFLVTLAGQAFWTMPELMRVMGVKRRRVNNVVHYLVRAGKVWRPKRGLVALRRAAA